MAERRYEHDCKPTAERPDPHPGISVTVDRWSCPDCEAKWDVTWRRSAPLGEPSSAEARRVSGPSRRWQRQVRRSVAAAGGTQ